MLKKTLSIFLSFLAFYGCSPRDSYAVQPLSPTATVPYKTFVYGIENVKLRHKIRSESKLVLGQNNPPKTINKLRMLAVEDMKNLQLVLGAEGYYDAELDFFIDIRTSPVTVYLKVSLGQRYTLGAFKIKSDPEDDPQIPMIASNINLLGIKVGMPAQKTKVKKAIDQVIKFLQDRGKPLAKIKEDRIVIDRASKEMHVALMIDTGPLARFGNTVIERNGGMSSDFIKSKLSWQKGDIYNREKIVQTIQKLNNSRLFRSINIMNGDKINSEGFLDIYVKLEGREPSEYIIGAEHGPKRPLTPNARWERRNLFGYGEILTMGTHMGAERKTGDVSLHFPDFKLVNLDLVTKVRAGKLDYPAYTKKGLDTKTTFQMPLFNPNIIGYGGVAFEINNVTRPGEDEKENTYRLIGVPLGVRYSKVEGGRQPKEGFRAQLKIFPYMTIFGKLKSYVRTKLKPEFFYPLTKEKNVVLTGWMNTSFTPGAGKGTIPTHMLNYPGGRNTVRGYKFQMAGPLTPEKDPKGGRSMMLMGVGLNHYLSEAVTLSAYMDWGTTYNRQYTDFSSAFLWGVGAGIKYHSEYGDFRLDVASPAKRRPSVDDAIEIYIGFEVRPYSIYKGVSHSLSSQKIRER